MPPMNDTNGLGELVPANARFYAAPIDFDTAIATGTNTTKEYRLSESGKFTVTHMCATFFLSAAAGTAVAGTPLCWDSDQSQSSNNMPSHAMVRVQITTSEWQWFANPVRLTNLFADGRSRNWFVVPPMLDNLSTSIFQVYNDSAVSIKGQFTLAGYRHR